ncbi:MAG TPA: amylo-alpha-1,6-glucosidase, partial [Anaeromyxobacteraceae bacterium]|nr:amylo-alpha-1,6-glucosidase [Anaeromyxobacteraceae bacterium]
EWLETNGTGGFAMGTVAGTNTRRYHGLLVVPLRPPGERHVLLARLEESLMAGGAEVALATNQYPGTLHPEGHRHLTGFRLDPFPTWTFEVGGVVLEKRLFLVHGEQAAVVRYRTNRPVHLRLRPFLAFRDYHALAKANGSLDPSVRESAGASGGVRTLTVRPYGGLPELRLHHSGGAFVNDGAWHRDTEYLEELDRGLDFREDLWRMGTIEMDADPGVDAFVVATTGPWSALDGAAVNRAEQAERVRRTPRSRDALAARLDAAAEQFLVERADGTPTVIAGYPWFTDWGRDTMIALPGLLLARGRLEAAREVISAFLAHARRGLIPNRFPDRGGVPEYNTVDATLWLFQAVHAYLVAGGDPGLALEVYPKAREILRSHREGTEHGIRVDPEDGLLIAGDPGAQLTWMDAKVGDWVVTPRHGKPVEVNALWYNAHRLAAGWARRAGDDTGAGELDHEAARIADSFEQRFWDPVAGRLFDVLLPEGPDRRLRPNQLFAVSLPFPLLDRPRQQAVVRVVERSLLTPVGLRTLASDERDYQPRYGGGPRERDGAYHQGLVWPWLLGPFIRACLNAFGRSRTTWAYCRSLLRGLDRHISEEGCLGSVSEILEPEPPYRPVGAPAQAWSVAEILNVLETELRTPPTVTSTTDASTRPASNPTSTETSTSIATSQVLP